MLKKNLILILLLLFEIFYSQKQIIKGRVANEDNINLGLVTVVNITTDEKIQTNYLGEFSIQASNGDELRFVRLGYERVSQKVLTDLPLLIILKKLPEEIREVKIARRNPNSISDGERVRQAVGLPQPVGRMREKPAEVKGVLLPILLGRLDVQGTYDLISGRARRQKRQYRYDDLLEDIAWLRSRLDDDYFTEKGIPKERISEFIEFSFSNQPQIRTFIRAGNLTAALFRVEDSVPVFVDRLKKKSD